MPYLLDGDFNITESSAIQRYIINKWGNQDLLGKNAQDNARLESFLSVFNEITGDIRGLFFNKEWETAKVETLKKYSDKLDQLEKFVGEKNHVLGYLSLGDFIVTEFSYYIETVYPEEFKKWSFLKRIRDHFNSIPEIVSFYSNGGFKGDFYPATALIKVTIPAEFKA